MITVEVAGLAIGIDNRYEYIEWLARDYLTDKPPIFTVRATEEEIRQEAEMTGEQFDDGYFEGIVIYRNIAVKLPEYDAFVFHGATLNLEGEAFLFTAPSGTGKTTHTRLWLTEFGDRVHYLNGDKPIIRLIDGIPYVCGTPWKGKEGYGKNEMARLSGIAFLERSPKNSAEPVSADDAVIRFITQMYIPKNEQGAVKTMQLADKVLTSVRLVRLACNMEREAAQVAYRALTGK